ncbi:MAG: hypothetical protein ACQER7_07710 [Bacteroidota bacterium]
MNKQSTWIKVLRYLLGAIILLFGLNGFLQFLPMPPMPEEASEFFGVLAKTGYMIPLLYGAEIIIAVLLLVNRFVPLMLLLFVPIALNILFFHLFLAPAEGLAGYVTVLLEVILLIAYKENYRCLFNARTR